MQSVALTLVILAAGKGTRFGGDKPMAAVGPNGECLFEYSIYDATKGAEVINGPATQPLTAILLSVNTDGHILATGTRGGHIYEEFLQKFGLRQSMEQGLSKPDVLSASETVAVPADSYSRQQILC